MRSLPLGVFLVVVVAASVLGLPSARAAAPESLALDYAAAPDVAGCPDAQAFAEGVAAHLGYDPFASGSVGGTGKGVRVRLRSVGAAGARLAGTIELRGADGSLLGSKSLAAGRCEDLASALTFAVAMAIDPSRAIHVGAAPSAPVAPPPPPSVVPAPSAPPPAAAVPAVAAPPVAPLPRLSLAPFVSAAGAVAGLGPVAGVTAAVYAGAGLRYGAGSLEIEGRYQVPSSQSVAASAGGGQVVTSTVGAALVPCGHYGPVFVCAQAFVGALQGQSEGIASKERGTTVFAQAGVRLGASIHLPATPLTLEPFADALVTLTPTQLNFLQGEVWSTRAVGLTAGVRLVLHFP